MSEPLEKGAGSPRRPTRGRESRARKLERALVVIDRLQAEYPDAHCELVHRNPFELLVATILSAQCTDARVNMVTPALFERFPTPLDLAGARQEEVEELVRSTGFYRNKARNLIGMANVLVDEHGGEVPETMAELVVLPGVGRKTANVVLSNAFGKAEGIVVDTHVKRIVGRLRLTRVGDPVRVERELMELLPHEHWGSLEHLLIWHGRAVCRSQRPRCGECVVADLCPSAQ